MADWEDAPTAPQGTILAPAVKTPDGVKVGKVGDSHDDIGGKDTPEQSRGFVDSKGNFLDREQAAKVAQNAGLSVPDKLHSEHLAEAAGKGWEDAPSPTARFMAGQTRADTRPWYERFGEGVRDPIQGAAQLLAKATPAPVERAVNAANNWLADKTGLVAKLPEGGLNEATRAREAEIQRERGGSTGTDWWRLAGNVASPINYVPIGIIGKGNALARVGSAAVGGAAANALQPVTSGNNFWAQKGVQAAEGAAVGGVIGSLAEGVSRGVSALGSYLSRNFPESLQHRAVQAVLSRVDADAAAGGPTAQQALDLLNTARSAAKPLTLADIGGENVKGLAGYVARQPGESRNIARTVLMGRDQGAPARLSADVAKYVSSGPSMQQTAEALMQSRASAAAPLYDKAFEGGSTAPLETQLRNSLQATTGVKGQISQQIAQIERDSPGALAARGAAGSEIRARYLQLHEQLKGAEADRVATMKAFEQARADGALNAPGAVWSPRIQQFLDDPIFKGGIARGLKIQRVESLAEGKPFNPTEYAIVGLDEKGGPVVGGVPNMRLLDAAKKGLDAIIQDERNPITGKLTEYGRAVDMARRAFLQQIDEANPTYKAARAAFSGPSRSLQVLDEGHAIFNTPPDEIAATFAKLSPNDKEFYRLGVADVLRERIAKTGFGGNEARAIIKNAWTREQLRPIFRSDEEFNRFTDAVMAEHTMAETTARTLKGSQTAERLAEDNSPDNRAIHSAASLARNMATGNWLHAIANGYRLKRDLGMRSNPELNTEIARILFSPNLPPTGQAGMRLLGTFPGPATRNMLARPAQAIQQAGPLFAPGAARLLTGGP